jgi:Inorganic pyrophosphatase
MCVYASFLSLFLSHSHSHSLSLTHSHSHFFQVLGVMALIDDGETDWKVITISVNDPEAAEFNDVDDVEKKRPGYLHAVYEWFRTYKMPAGDPANEFAFDGATRNRDYALEVIKENYELYLSLIAGDKNPKDEVGRRIPTCLRHNTSCVFLFLFFFSLHLISYSLFFF